MTKAKRQEGGAVMFTDGHLSRRKRTRVLRGKSRKRWKEKKNDSMKAPNPSRLTSRYEIFRTNECFFSMVLTMYNVI